MCPSVRPPLAPAPTPIRLADVGAAGDLAAGDRRATARVSVHQLPGPGLPTVQVRLEVLSTPSVRAEFALRPRDLELLAECLARAASDALRAGRVR